MNAVTSKTITPAHVRAGVERELRTLTATGCTGPDAIRAAINITRSKIINSPLFAECQVSASRCHVCGGTERSSEAFLPVLSADPGRTHWLHINCHAEHVRRHETKADRIMAVAGYGDELEKGAA